MKYYKCCGDNPINVCAFSLRANFRTKIWNVSAKSFVEFNMESTLTWQMKCFRNLLKIIRESVFS